MASTRLQSLIQVVFYNSESQRKRTSEASLQSPAWMVQTRAHARWHTYTHTKACDYGCMHSHTCTFTQTCAHTSTLARCFEGWDSVLKTQAARRSWPCSGTDEQLPQFLCLCMCGQESVWACMLEQVRMFMNECMHVCSLVCVHTGLAHSWGFTTIVHLCTLRLMKAQSTASRRLWCSLLVPMVKTGPYIL